MEQRNDRKNRCLLKGFNVVKVMILSVSFVMAATSNPSMSYAVPATRPTEVIKDMLARIMAVQTRPQGQISEKQRREAIKEIINENFDCETMAKNALKDIWKKLNRDKRKQFKDLFRELFLDSYANMVINFLGKENVKYEKEDISRGYARVKTVIEKTDSEIRVDYLLRHASNKWLVYDVIIDDVSIVKNYNRSFMRVINKTSFNNLLKRLKLQTRINREAEQGSKKGTH